MKLHQIQSALKQTGAADGWLFSDFHHRDPLGGRVLGLDPAKICKRRWFYFVPAVGAPQKLVHAIEQFVLDDLPGKKCVYRGHVELREKLQALLQGARSVAMQYSPMGHVPMVSLIDAGTVELVRSLGVEVRSSADLIARIHSIVSTRGFKLHAEAGLKVQAIKDAAFKKIFDAVASGRKLDEFALQQFIVERFAQANLVSDAPPIVAVDDHAADPHFEVSKKNPRAFKKHSRILLDMWAKVNAPGAIYYDITWCGYAGAKPPARYAKLFEHVTRARDAALDFVRDGLAAGRTVRGWEIDKACRDVIAAQGLEPHFLHRTGHSIDSDVHGSGANIDGLETLDDRAILPSTCFSIEPGIYLDGIGVRTEISVCIDAKNRVKVIGDMQRELMLP